jgi:hypothetical protein
LIVGDVNTISELKVEAIFLLISEFDAKTIFKIKLNLGQTN